MRSSRTIQIVSVHAGGEIGDVITGPHTHDYPWSLGYRLSDTWPGGQETPQ